MVGSSRSREMSSRSGGGQWIPAAAASSGSYDHLDGVKSRDRWAVHSTPCPNIPVSTLDRPYRDWPCFPTADPLSMPEVTGEKG